MNHITPKTEFVNIIRGASGGGVAIVPMTAFMLGAHRLLPQRQKYALPPEQITDRIAKRFGVRKHMNKDAVKLASLASHLGYGIGFGALYGTSLRRVWRGPLSGIAYALGVWAVGYLGWIPAVDLLPSASRQPPKRVAIMVVAHVIWGAVLGLACELFPQTDGLKEGQEAKS